MKKNSNETIISLFFVFLGSIFFVIGVFLCISTFTQKGKVETKGVITQIESYQDSDGDTHYDVYVSYDVNGRKYTSELSSYSSSFYEGKEMNIYYLESNPSKIGSFSMDLMLLMFPGIGLLCIIVGLSFQLVKLKKKRLLKRLKIEGELVYATYAQTIINTGYSVNGVHPYVILCNWVNPSDGKQYTFKSENLWEDPQYIIESSSITSFPVYITKERVNPYVMDLEILDNNIY